MTFFPFSISATSSSESVLPSIASELWMVTLDPFKESDLKRSHAVMMEALVDDAGQYRNGGVGVFGEKGLMHMAPGASMVPLLMGNLFEWLNNSQDHLARSNLVLSENSESF